MHRHVTTIVSDGGGRPVSVRVKQVTAQVSQGPDTGQAARLSGRTLRVGTSPTNDLVLTDPRVSRFHCRIVADDDGYHLTDTGSANGTFVREMRVRDVWLADGTRVRVGDSEIVIRFDDEESEIELWPEESFGGAVGRSVVMRELFARARRAAATDATVLLLGETGTGKDVIARAIHDHSQRTGGPFEVFDCGAVAPTLIEAALFGHVRGAFTGADADHPGVFERAHGGTLFLDELGELDVALQPKLLRALETQTVTRVGGTMPISVDVRIIAATNRDLRAEVEAERFRSDLFYRVAVILLDIPPLRDRPDDAPLLASYFLREILARDHTEALALRAQIDELFGRLSHYPWPGNVRELRNVIERAATMADPEQLEKDLFSRMIEMRDSVNRTLGRRPPLKEAREQFDREYLRDVLDAAQGQVARAAEIADVHPKSLSRLLRRYKLRE